MKKGFYVIKKSDILIPYGYKEVIYTTGSQENNNHKYCRDMGGTVSNLINRPMEWVELLWAAVLRIEDELESNYDYYENFEDIPNSWGFPSFPK